MGITGAMVELKSVCWLGMSVGTMYSGVLPPGYVRGDSHSYRRVIQIRIEHGRSTYQEELFSYT